MSRRRDRWGPPPPGGVRPTDPPQVIELYPNPPPPPAPPVDLTAGGAAPEVIELYPNAVPPHPLFDRAASLAGLQAAFALLDDDELQVARLRMFGVRLADIAEELGMHDEDVEQTWKRARQKLGNALFGKQPSPPPS